jgi:hypothetical protein
MVDAFATHEEALAAALANLKGTHQKDLLRAARALAFLTREAGSQVAVAEMVGVSREIVREFLSLLRLPDDVQAMIASGELSTLEQGRRLAQLARYRPHEVAAAAREMTSLTAHDSRSLTDYLIAHRDVTPAEAKAKVLGSKDVVTREFHVVALLNEDEYHRLVEVARRKGQSPDELVSSIVRDVVGREGVAG